MNSTPLTDVNSQSLSQEKAQGDDADATQYAIEHSDDDVEDMKPYDVFNDDPAQQLMTNQRKAPAQQDKYAKSFDLQIRSGLLPPPPHMFEPESHAAWKQSFGLETVPLKTRLHKEKETDMRPSRRSDSYAKTPSQWTAATPVTREHKRKQRQCLETMFRLKKAIGILEEKFAKQKKVDTESYHFQFFGLNTTNAKVMKATHVQLVQKKKDFNACLAKLKEMKGKHAIHGLRREHGYHDHTHH